MLKPLEPYTLYNSENGNGQDGDGQKSDGQSSDGQKGQDSKVDFSDLVTKFDKMSHTTEKWATEMGEVRKVGESLNDLVDRLSSIEDKLSSKEKQEIEFDPFDKEQMQGMVSGIVDQVVKPLKESQELFMTRDGFSEMLQVAATGASLKKDFKLKDKEVEELNTEAQEKGLNVEHLAYQKYGDRRFVKNVNAELAEEMKKKDTGQPEETALEAEYKKVGIPKDHREFDKSFREKGSDATKQALLSADKAARV